MRDWANRAKGIPAAGTIVEFAAEILSATSAGNEAQLQMRVEALMGKHFLGADVVRAMLQTQNIGSVAPLPKNIVEVLNRESPVHGQGTLVKDSHLLAFIPENVSLKMLSEALGGRAGKKFYAEWFIKEKNPIADLTLSTVGQKGHWVLIPDCFPPGTESKGNDASVTELNQKYGQSYSQPDVISFTTALLLNDFKNNERWYSTTMAWCRDPRPGGSIEESSSFGVARSLPPFDVGDFEERGLELGSDEPDSRYFCLGCAACWNFDN